MKNTKVKNILGKIKNIILIASVLFSMLILFSDIIYNNILITFISKLLAIFNLYAFLSVNKNKLLKY